MKKHEGICMRRLIGVLGLGSLLAVGFVSRGEVEGVGATGGAPATAALSDSKRIELLLKELAVADVDALPALPIEPFVIPAASVDVMRVRLNETYVVHGVGTDTVELTGWIAVRHDNPRAARGERSISWGTAVSDTEFVGLELKGVSKIFGPVQVSLDRTRPSRGQVGKLAMPFLQRVILDVVYQGAAATPAGASLSEATLSDAQQPPVRRQLGPREQEVARSLRGLWDAISRKDAAGMLRHYSKRSGTLFFNEAYSELAATDAERYVRDLSRVFENVTSVKVVPDDDMRVVIRGNVASVIATGRNEVVDREGRRGVGPWRYTAELTREGRQWLITHDHLSFFRDPKVPVDKWLLNAGGACAAMSPAAGCCITALAVSVNMPKLDLEMRTKYPVQWYSEVTTIPPVGHEGSVSVAPTPLLSAGREVAVLQRGRVTFREVVRRVELQGDGR